MISKNTFVATIVLFLAACSNKKYSVEILSMDPITKIQSSDTINFESYNDTTAFETAVKKYWFKKAAVKKVNKTLETNEPEPFFFSLMNENGNPIHFPADIAERLSKPTIQFMKDSVLPFIDTITPLSKQPQERTANIYQ